MWPRIVQIGQDRGGFYSYTFLGNLIGCDFWEPAHFVMARKMLLTIKELAERET